MSTPRRPAPRSSGAPMTVTDWPCCASTRARLTSAPMGTEPPGSGRIRVLLADDDELFLQSLRPLVEGQEELEVVATAGDGLAALELVDELQPDAVVMDLHMPLLDGVTAVTRAHAPELHRAADEAGADAVLLKDELVQTLLDRLTQARQR